MAIHPDRKTACNKMIFIYCTLLSFSALLISVQRGKKNETESYLDGACCWMHHQHYYPEETAPSAAAVDCEGSIQSRMPSQQQQTKQTLLRLFIQVDDSIRQLSLLDASARHHVISAREFQLLRPRPIRVLVLLNSSSSSNLETKFLLNQPALLCGCQVRKLNIAFQSSWAGFNWVLKREAFVNNRNKDGGRIA